MRRDVGTLLCAGIDLPKWNGIRGHGIRVVPDAMGEPAVVLNSWCNGQLQLPPEWPVYADWPANAGKGRKRHRTRGGR